MKKKNKNQILEKKSDELINSDLASKRMATEVLEVYYYTILFIICFIIFTSYINYLLYRHIYIRK